MGAASPADKRMKLLRVFLVVGFFIVVLAHVGIIALLAYDTWVR